MKTSQTFITTLTGLMILSQAACSAKVDAKTDGPSNPGPQMVAVAGTWSTGCKPDAGGTFATINSVTLTGTQEFERSMKIYMDTTCTNEAPGSAQVWKGAYTFSNEQIPNAPLPIDLVVTDPQGQVAKTYDVILFEGNKMYMGAYQGLNPESRPADVDRSVVYNRQ